MGFLLRQNQLFSFHSIFKVFLPKSAPKNFYREGFKFSKNNPNPIVFNLFQTLMNMHAIIIEQGFPVIVAFCYNISLFRNPVTTILEVLNFEDCVRENKLPLWHIGAWGRSPQPLSNSGNFFGKNSHFNAIWKIFWTFIEQLEKSLNY